MLHDNLVIKILLHNSNIIIGECVQLPSGTDVYTITNGNQSTALGSFEHVN